MIKIEYKGKIERGGKIIEKDNAVFEIKDGQSLKGDKEKATHIELFDKANGDREKNAGAVVIEEVNDQDLARDYVQLRLVSVSPEYQGGNAVMLLYKKSIEYAESLNKKLLFDSSLTIGAYKSFKKLGEEGFVVIENPDATFDGQHYRAPKSWVLRVERKPKES